MRARHRLSKLLLRHDVSFEGHAWTERHRAWLAKVKLGEHAAQAALTDYRGAVEALVHRRGELERQIAAAIPSSPWAREVGRLRCLRGVDTLTAVGLCAEIGDFARFAKAGQLMSYLGLVPSEHSSGESRRLGSITRSGSRHARRLLVEAAWHYRNQPRVGAEIERRQASQPPAGGGDRLVGAAASSPRLVEDAAQRQTPDPDRRRRRSRTRRLLLVDRPGGMTAPPADGWRGGGQPAFAREQPRFSYEQPARAGDVRS
jgi:hypothetical protein